MDVEIISRVLDRQDVKILYVTFFSFFMYVFLFFFPKKEDRSEWLDNNG